MSLTEREKEILRLRAAGLSDYGIARKLKIDPANLCRSRKVAMKKVELAKADLEFAQRLKLKS